MTTDQQNKKLPKPCEKSRINCGNWQIFSTRNRSPGRRAIRLSSFRNAPDRDNFQNGDSKLQMQQS
jgi:hypothetical protein